MACRPAARIKPLNYLAGSVLMQRELVFSIDVTTRLVLWIRLESE